MMDVTPTGGGCFGIIVIILLGLFGASFFMLQAGDMSEETFTEPAIVVTAVAPSAPTLPPPPAIESSPSATPEVFFALADITCGDQLDGEVAGPSALVTGLYATRDITVDTLFTRDDVSETEPMCP